MSDTATPTPPAGERTAAVAPRPDLLGLTRDRLAERLAGVVDRPFRVEQVYRALHLRGVDDFAAMTDLPLELRGRLAERFSIGTPRVAERLRSADGTVKYLLELADGAVIETVDIPDGDRHTLCISSQAGCALACGFCVTGYWGAGRRPPSRRDCVCTAVATAARPRSPAPPAPRSDSPRCAPSR
jgi:23S rRNA (adenine2503-C2)-methyltransferase